MATLSVWKFPTADGAEKAEETLGQLQTEGLIKVHDAALATWPEGKKRPKTRQAHNLTGAGALGGAFWGLLFGILFFIPLIGLAVGAAAGALTGSLAHAGIDEDFVQQIRDKVTPGTSALFVLTSDAVIDKVHDRFKGTQAELISSNLSKDQEKALLEAFKDEN